MPDVWDRCDLKSQRRSFWTVCCDWFARTITHDHPRSPKTSATSRAISLLFAHDSNIFRSQLGRNMVVSPVWLALKSHCLHCSVVYLYLINHVAVCWYLYLINHADVDVCWYMYLINHVHVAVCWYLYLINHVDVAVCWYLYLNNHVAVCWYMYLINHADVDVCWYMYLISHAHTAVWLHEWTLIMTQCWE